MLGMIGVSCVISLALLAAIHSLARSRFGAGGVCWLALGATIPLLLCFFPALALQSVLTFVLTLGCLALRSRPRTVVLTAAVAMVASYGIFFAISIPELRELSRLRREFPVESMSRRLAYETNATKAPSPTESASEAPELSPGVDQRLSRFEGESRGNIRRHMLASLHSRTSDEFVLARGFGPVRMLGVRADHVELPESNPIPVPALPESEPTYEPDRGGSPALADEENPARLLPPENELLAMHTSGMEDLFDRERMGYVRDREHVVGFQPHRFTNVPALAAPKNQPQSSWKIVRLELVSLLKHDSPVAYVSKYLPQMDELRDAPTRPLSEFERQALGRLRAEEDVVIREGPNRIQMIGSLRAGKHCLDCHSVQRGDLLGALTYELVPQQPVRNEAAQVPLVN
jgi:hypothetical protein